MKLLIIDDEASVREAYRQVLEATSPSQNNDSLSKMADDLFGDDDPDRPSASNDDLTFDVHYAAQGEEGISLIRSAKESGEPFKVAFIDIRMPPGIDGKETARRIRAIDSQINLVIVTAYSDHSVTDIAAVAGPADKIFYISKPFAAEEVRQMATALSRRWDFDAGQVALLEQKIAELRASEARANHAATHDFLTGAPNRKAYFAELAHLLLNDRSNFSLALIDLDRFKHVNDTFGHGAGDDLLIAVHKLLSQTAPKGSIVARMGGDEFGLIIPESDRKKAHDICHELTTACSRTFSILGNSVNIGASCGLMIPSDYPSREMMELVRCADLALFAAKEAGRGIVRLFDQEMDASQRFRQQVEDGLRHAIERNELVLHFQPIVERNSLEVAGFEALLRWESPDHGMVSPNVFIPIAEESQLIDELGEWVVDQALSESLNWPEMFVSINFSPRQFRRGDFLGWLNGKVAKWGVQPGSVQIEITETAIFEDTDRAVTLLQEIEAAGYRVALDDFGTGYSSLLNIKNFALSCIKIDKSFIDGLGQDRHSTAIVGSVVHLADALGLSVVAEGVESNIQCELLRVSGCSHLQGFLFGRAKPSSEVLDTLAQINSDALRMVNR